MSAPGPDPNIDCLARALAASAGLNWERLDHYPGFTRGRWRSEAERLIGKMGRRENRAA
ncbi:MAG TPA: hypothetical protein VF631_14955 [Allosphingosinicella sp.]|jgi:hypothetical protein|uniref:hypothetical protein n=1 Tax=Allosphingosinicella sp. TaxID=2823234 RepID=UPI002F2A0931